MPCERTVRVLLNQDAQEQCNDSTTPLVRGMIHIFMCFYNISIELKENESLLMLLVIWQLKVLQRERVIDFQ